MTSNNLFKKAPLFAAFFFLMACSQIETPTTQKYLFQPKLNTPFAHKFTITAKIAQTFEGTTYESSMIQSFDIHQTAKSITPDSLQVSAYFSDIDLKIFSQQQTMRIRSKSKDTADARSQIVKNLLHKPFQITYRPDGSIVSINNWDETIMKTVIQIMAGTGADVNGNINEFLKTLGSETLIGHLELVTAFLPEDGILPEDSTWRKSIVFINNVSDKPVTMVYQYNLSDDGLNIAGTTLIAPTPYVEPNSKISYAMGGDIKLELLANTNTGIAESAVIKQQLKGKATLPLTEQRHQPYEMPMTTSAEVKWTRINL